MRIIIISVLLINSLNLVYAQSKDLKLPIIFHNSQSVHASGLSQLQNCNQVSDTSKFVKQLKEYDNIRVENIEIYLAAITSIWDDSFRNSFNYVLVTDKSGNEKMIVDANNNNDFSDDIVFFPDTLPFADGKPIEQISSVKVEYDWAENDKKVKRYVDVNIAYHLGPQGLVCAFAHYGTADFFGKKLEIVPREDLTYMNFDVYTDTSRFSPGISANKFLNNKETVFRIKEVDVNNNFLILEKQNTKLSETTSAQAGFRVPTFTAPEWFSKERISTEKLKGKYIFIDIWALWCSPCIKDLPKIQEIYSKIDPEKITFVSIVSKDDSAKIEKIISSNGLTFPLVEANGENMIINKFKVNAFPTTLFVDPKGIVLKTDFRTKELEEILTEHDLFLK